MYFHYRPCILVFTLQTRVQHTDPRSEGDRRVSATWPVVHRTSAVSGEVQTRKLRRVFSHCHRTYFTGVIRI